MRTSSEAIPKCPAATDGVKNTEAPEIRPPGAAVAAPSGHVERSITDAIEPALPNRQELVNGDFASTLPTTVQEGKSDDIESVVAVPTRLAHNDSAPSSTAAHDVNAAPVENSDAAIGNPKPLVNHTDAATKRHQEQQGVPILKLKDLNPTSPAPWAFIARVIARNPVREWKTWQEAGTLMEVYVADSLHGCTRVTLFNEAVRNHHSAVAPGITCYFSGGRIKRAFSSKDDVEISFGSGSDIHQAPNPLHVVPQIATTPLAAIAALAEGSTSTVIAVVHGLGSLKRIVTRKKKTTEKRDLLLVDDTDYKLVCTTWGQLARDIETLSEGSIVVVKDCLLGSYNNLRTASIGVGSALLYEPEHARTDILREWYGSLAPSHSFSPLALK